MNCAVATGVPPSPSPQPAAASAAATAAATGFASAVDAAVALAAPAAPSGIPVPGPPVPGPRPVALPVEVPPAIVHTATPAAIVAAVPNAAALPRWPELRASISPLDLPAAAAPAATPKIAGTPGAAPDAALVDAVALPTSPLVREPAALRAAGVGASPPLATGTAAPREPADKAAPVPADVAPQTLNPGRTPTAASAAMPVYAVEASSLLPGTAVAVAIASGPPAGTLAAKAMARSEAASANPPVAGTADRAALPGILAAQSVGRPVVSMTDSADTSKDADPVVTPQKGVAPPAAPPSARQGLAPAEATEVAVRTALPLQSMPVAHVPAEQPAATATAPAPRLAPTKAESSSHRPIAARPRRGDATSPAPVTPDVAAPVTALPASPFAPAAIGGTSAAPGAVRPSGRSILSTAADDAPAANAAQPLSSPLLAAVGAAIDSAVVVPAPRQPADGHKATPIVASASTPARPGLVAGAQPVPTVTRDGSSVTAPVAVADHRDAPLPGFAPGDRVAPDAMPAAPGGIAPLPITGTVARQDATISVATVAEPVVTARPGQIGHELGVQIATRVSAGGDQLVVRLVPAELGRIEVHMSFDQQGGLRAVIAADSPVALDMLRRDSADLSRSLSDAGVRSDAGSLRFQTDTGSGGGSGGSNGQPRSPWLHADTRADRPGRDPSFTDASEPATYRQLRTSGRYDLFA